MQDRLPDDYLVELSASVRIDDVANTLVGGAPPSVVYLRDEGRRMLERRRLRVSDADSAALADELIDLGMAHPVANELPPVDDDDITYVIPVRDRPDQLSRLLTSMGPDKQIIVVDDYSLDAGGTVRVAEAYGARVVKLPKNLGPGGARNAGLREVTTPFVAFVDSDVVVEPDTMTLLARHFADPRVVIVLPRVLGLYGSKETNWIGRYENSRSSLDLGGLPSLIHPRAVASWAPGTCTIARTNALGDGFIEELRVGEDVDLAWRLGSLGHRVRYDPSITVRHDHRVKLMPWMARKAFYGSSSSPLTKRHPYFVAPALLSPTNIGVIAAVVAQRRWSIPLIATLTGITALRTHLRLRPGRRRVRLSLSLALDDLIATGYQLMGILLRHWWPITMIGCLFSKRLRRLALVTGFVDAFLARRRNHGDLDFVRYMAGRRLDDLSFGAGVWRSAWKERSIRTFIPDMRRKPSITSKTELAEVVRPAR